MLKIGKIVNTHGIKGEVKIKRITDFAERFAVGNTVYIEIENEYKALKIAQHRMHKNMDLVQFEGYDNINDVEGMKTAFLYIKKEQLTSLDEGEYYYYEIIGCTVETHTGEIVGVIDHILAPGANDVWVVKTANRKEILIPYIDSIVKSVDVEAKKVIIEPMEGLLE